MSEFFRLSRRFFLAIFAICVATLGVALTAQFSLSMPPCLLCEYERIPYAVAGAVAALALIPSLRHRLGQWLGVLILLVVIASALLGGYHVGVERKIWEGPACTAEEGTAISFTNLEAAASKPTEPPCDEVQGRFGGLSLAEWNTVFSLLLAGYIAGVLVFSRVFYREIEHHAG